MFYIAVSIVALVVVLEIAAWAVLKKEERKRGLLCSAVLIIKVKRLIVAKYFPDKNLENKRYYEEVFVGENSEDMAIRNEGKNAHYALLFLLATAGFYIAASAGGLFQGKYITSLKRPESGLENRVIIAEYDGSLIEMNLNIESKEPNKSEREDIFNGVKEELLEYILADNASPSLVTSDLRFDTELGSTGVKAYYGSSNPEIITGSGEVKSDKLSSEKQVSIIVHLSYYDYKEDIVYDLIVVPPNIYSAKKALVYNEINKANSSDRYEEFVELPTEIDGESVRFKADENSNAYIIVVLGVWAALLMIPYGMEQRKTLRNKRNSELIVDYPEVISKLALLLEAGLTVRVAFERIANDYERRKKRTGIKKQERRYVYEEMIRARNEISLGVAESEAYAHFGRRCGNMYYIRLAALLSQNIRKGGASLVVSLRQEIIEAHREKSAQIKKTGEEISMKLLIPMMGMFTVVLAIILIPSFLTI